MADVTVRLTIGNFTAEVTGPADYVDKKLDDLVERFLGSWKPSAVTETKTAVPAPPGGKQVSPAEFLKKRNVKNQTDRALMLGYYLEKFQSQSSFTSTELGEMGVAVRDPFGNISDVVARLT